MDTIPPISKLLKVSYHLMRTGEYSENDQITPYQPFSAGSHLLAVENSEHCSTVTAK